MSYVRWRSLEYPEQVGAMEKIDRDIIILESYLRKKEEKRSLWSDTSENINMGQSQFIILICVP